MQSKFDQIEYLKYSEIDPYSKSSLNFSLPYILLSILIELFKMQLKPQVWSVQTMLLMLSTVTPCI